MESIASTSVDETGVSKQNQTVTPMTQGSKRNSGGTFTCAYCSLKERFDFKGAKPPFARQITYLEDCYIMKDPFSLPNKGEVLVLGGDCSVCEKSVCLGCSIYFAKRFCFRCALNNIQHLPSQLHPKIKNIQKSGDS